MKAIGDRLIIEPIFEEVQSDSGFVWVDNDINKMRYQKAKVVSRGTHVQLIKDNDMIYYDKHRADSTVIEGQTVMIIRESDVVVVLD